MSAPRLSAVLIAAVALTGLVVQFTATLHGNGSVTETLWILLRFFTIMANMLVLAALGAIAAGCVLSPRMIGGVTLMIMLVGVTYMLLLRGMLELSGGALLADTLLHKVTPVLVPLWWIIFGTKGGLRWSDPWIWAIFPAAYLPYALVRGMSGDIYAYPFINVAKLGWAQVGLNALAIAAGFIAAGYMIVWIDRRMTPRR